MTALRSLPVTNCSLLILLLLAPACAVQEEGAPPAPAPTPKKKASASAKHSFGGVWSTTYGDMRLIVKGESVKGTYADGPESTIVGTLKGSRLDFTCSESTETGEGWFEFSSDGRKFNGKWRKASGAEWKKWTGKKNLPEPGRKWMVIIERRWQESLAETDYSSGEMCEAYFRKDGHVAVRSRFFTDSASLRKWLRQVACLPGPAYVYFDTHGSTKGVMSDDGDIEPQVIADALEFCPNVKLLHFGACLVMKGDYPDRLIAALGDRATFPISGYKASVDWDHSSIIEWAYDILVLNRGLSPAKAGERLKRIVPTCGDEKIEGAVFGPAGFVVIPARVARK